MHTSSMDAHIGFQNGLQQKSIAAPHGVIVMALACTHACYLGHGNLVWARGQSHGMPYVLTNSRKYNELCKNINKLLLFSEILILLLPQRKML